MILTPVLEEKFKYMNTVKQASVSVILSLLESLPFLSASQNKDSDISFLGIFSTWKLLFVLLSLQLFIFVSVSY